MQRALSMHEIIVDMLVRYMRSDVVRWSFVAGMVVAFTISLGVYVCTKEK